MSEFSAHVNLDKNLCTSPAPRAYASIILIHMLNLTPGPLNPLQELRGVDTKTLTRQELRNHLEARDLPTTGNKGQLALRLEASVLDEQVKGWNYNVLPCRNPCHM